MYSHTIWKSHSCLVVFDSPQLALTLCVPSPPISLSLCLLSLTAEDLCYSPLPPLLEEDQTVEVWSNGSTTCQCDKVLFMLFFFLNWNILSLIFDHRRSYLLIMSKFLDCKNLASGHLKVPMYACRVFENGSEWHWVIPSTHLISIPCRSHLSMIA